MTEDPTASNADRRIPRIDVEGVLREFGIEDCLGISEAGGWLNDNLAVKSSNGNFLLKRINRRHPLPVDHTKLHFRHSLIEYLVASGFPTPRLHRTRRGDIFVEKGSFIFELYDHVRGDAYTFGNESQLKSLGANLACFHKLGEEMGVPTIRLQMGTDTVEEGRKKIRAGAYQEVGAEDRDSIDEKLARIQTAYGNASAGLAGRNLNETLIHGDVHPGNFVFSGGEVAAVLDFDFSGRGRKTWDICLALIKFSAPNYGVDNYRHSTTPPISLRIDEGKAMVVLHSYLDEFKLPRAAIEALPDQIIATFIERKSWMALFIPIESHLRLLQEMDSSIDDLITVSQRLISRLL